MTLQNLILLAFAGAAGTLCRYGLGGLVQRLAGERFPLGTLSVNLLGCLAFGLVWGLLAERAGFSTQTRIIVLGGFLGAFTTFSTYVFETLTLLQSGQILAAMLNVGLQTVLGLGCVLLGLALAQAI
jgi:fluoride exporter